MTLEELMAFTVCTDHQRQEQVWDAVKDSWQKNAFAIRRMLTESAVRASDKRALFVGADAYEAASLATAVPFWLCLSPDRRRVVRKEQMRWPATQ